MGVWNILKKLYKGAETAAETTAEAAGAAAKSAAAATGAAAKAAGGAVSTGAASLHEKAVGKLLGDTGDRLSAVLEKLRNADLDDAVKSWIAKGNNKTVTADQVKAALGDEEVKSVATEMGVSSDEAAGTIARILPTIIDKLTPDGLVPDPEAVAKKLTNLWKK
jgi:uncharacterized protein YidB (DUF937 family)